MTELFFTKTGEQFIVDGSPMMVPIGSETVYTKKKAKLYIGNQKITCIYVGSQRVHDVYVNAILEGA